MTLRSWLSRDELVQLYEQVGGFIHVGEEDFGITMVEALAAGTPVIALDRGGARDIVRHGVDGVLVDIADIAALRKAIERVAASNWSEQELALRARQFSRERFVKNMQCWIGDLISSAVSDRNHERDD